MDGDEVLRRLKRILFWILVLGGGLYFFVEFYLPQKINQFGDVIERTKKGSESDGPVSKTLLPDSAQYDPEVHRIYRKEKDYPGTYRLLKGEISAGAASVSDYRLMLHLLTSDKDLGISPENRKERLSEYRAEVEARDEG